jgi:hypothetical protein
MTTIPQLIKKLDKVFSEFIRRRDADENGIGTCITCGRRKEWKYMDCGHYIKRQHMNTRFDEMCCQGQCKHCNNFEQGADAKFRAALVKKYGEEAVLLLEYRGKLTKKWSRFELELLIDKYKNLLK